MAKRSPSKTERLELDIDLRLTDLWREIEDVAFDEHWSQKQPHCFAAFMRAAYGKGYSDAFTEEREGSLCHDHGYRIPSRRVAT